MNNIDKIKDILQKTMQDKYIVGMVYDACTNVDNLNVFASSKGNALIMSEIYLKENYTPNTEVQREWEEAYQWGVREFADWLGDDLIIEKAHEYLSQTKGDETR